MYVSPLEGPASATATKRSPTSPPPTSAPSSSSSKRWPKRADTPSHTLVSARPADPDKMPDREGRAQSQLRRQRL